MSPVSSTRKPAHTRRRGGTDPAGTAREMRETGKGERHKGKGKKGNSRVGKEEKVVPRGLL